MAPFHADAAREATPPMKGAAQSDPFQPSTGLADDTSPDEWKAFLASDLANEQLDHEDDDLDPEDQEIAQVTFCPNGAMLHSTRNYRVMLQRQFLEMLL